MVNRLLLTLLALLTGLSAQPGPAEARAAQFASMQVAIAGEVAVAKASRAPVALARLPEPGLLNTRRHAPAIVAVAVSPAIRAVLAGIDRARE
jgi:hypothetical protein